MIRERPGEPNDREYVLSNNVNDRRRDEHFDKEYFEQSYDNFSSFVPWYDKKLAK